MKKKELKMLIWNGIISPMNHKDLLKISLEVYLFMIIIIMFCRPFTCFS